MECERYGLPTSLDTHLQTNLRKQEKLISTLFNPLYLNIFLAS